MADPTEDTFRTAIAAAHVAVAAGDYTTARGKILEAEILNAGLPLESRQGTAWMQRRESLSAVRKAIDEVEMTANQNSDTGRFVKFGTGFRHGVI